jgi:hypothetical protein
MYHTGAPNAAAPDPFEDSMRAVEGRAEPSLVEVVEAAGEELAVAPEDDELVVGEADALGGMPMYPRADSTALEFVDTALPGAHCTCTCCTN